MATEKYDLGGRRILVVEDEYLLAFELARLLNQSNAVVVGPVATVLEAAAYLDEKLDGAILDINLRGEMVFPLAARLRSKAIPIVFLTGYDGWMVPHAFDGVARLDKPLDAEGLVAALQDFAPAG